MQQCPENFESYSDLHKWSINDMESFWSQFWDFSRIKYSKNFDTVLENPVMPGAKWFSGSKLNYAENLLEGVPEQDAIISLGENKPAKSLTFRELNHKVSSVQKGLIDLGVKLSPNKNTYQNARYGRAYLSLEQISELNSPFILLSQSNEVSGENESLSEIENNPLWQNLPAVKNGDVIVINRLGYPGVEGRMEFIKDFREGLTK